MIATEPITNSVAYQTPIRSSYTGSRVSRSGADDISHAADGAQQHVIAATIELLAQPADQHVHDVCLLVEAVVPDVGQDHGLRDNLARVAHQIFEQRELPRTQV